MGPAPMPAPWPHESVTIVRLHQSFAVSVFLFATAPIRDWTQAQTGGTTMATLQKKAGWIERLKQSFHRFWNE
jgi:hypothetical protein